MSLDELLRERVIHRINPDHGMAGKALLRARRDVATAGTLIGSGEFDWSLAIAYNGMLSAGRALMFSRGYRPSSTDGHLAVVRFLQAVLGAEASDRMVMTMNGLRKKRHTIVYEEMGVVSEDEARQAVRWAEEFVNRIEAVIKANQV